MRKPIFFLLIILCAGFISCQKEITLDIIGSGSSGGSSTNGNLLVKLDRRSGTDSNVTYYTYNTAKQLIATRTIISSNGGITNWYSFERNAAGLIVRRKQYATTALLPIPADTSITNYHYSTGATPQITYSTATISYFGFSVDDSTVYTYNTSGKLVKSEMYQSDILTGTYQLSMRYMYTYDAAGNAAKLESYNLQSGIAVLLSTNVFTYDIKTSPTAYTEAEAIAIDNKPAAVHNLTGDQMSSSIGGAVGISNIYTFTYNSSNKPSTGKQTLSQAGATTVTNFTFYYQ